MKVLFVGGGTGGHINPALAMAGYFKRREPDVEILYVGAEGGMECRLVPAAGYEMKTIRISGFQRKVSLQNVVKNAKTVVRMFTATAQAKKIIKDFDPDVCVGTGGYVSGPVLRAAAKMGYPCVIHESNAFPGVTTKMVAHSVHTVMLAVEDAKKYFDSNVNCEVTGNPVRAEVLDAEREASRRKLNLDDRPVILSFGGSLGAAALNRSVAEMLKLSSKDKKYQHIHGYGTHDDDFKKKIKSDGITKESDPQIQLLEYIHDMPTALAAADIVIGRAGAMTLTEIEAKGKASILIPSPNVAENHQFHNANALVQHGAAVMIEEKNLTGEILWQTIEKIINTPGKLQALEENAGEMGIKEADLKIYHAIKKAARTKITK
ncbi:undecaprenyldiphospho-muramoylpentapeptide beta-N-acetylglucosaminyltransferase [Scatolibacter rhodanostii]|uniref:undecaprenyldiphospho-muramoylpentapeptide beta-N-acetylglucosaminyltransferase n=1 Tax=Scatolibacter rhodanostii TaxID=2014781 RepID=UPI000C07CBDC|nr:undecaprenyldiphospho-muramoylpentapeptide beta-N-acetylglucosaminyltransferase [Scatolibacter rhodanostii]